MMNDFVSIITPSFNSKEFICLTINSVISQSYENWEMIIVDDCSIDGSVEFISNLIKNESRIRLITLDSNVGAAIARNEAIKLASGRYIAFLDSDDLWVSDKLEKQIDFMQKTGAVFSFSAYNKINEDGVIVGRVGVPEQVRYYDLLKTCVIGCLTVVYDTQYFGKVEMPLIRKRQDFGLWLRLLKKTDYAYGIEEVLGQYRVHSNSISANKLDTIQFTWRLYRDIEELSFLTASYYFAHYFIKGLFRTKLPRLSKLIGFLD